MLCFNINRSIQIPEEKEFFNVTRSSENVVCHFYRDETFRCKILDKHLSKKGVCVGVSQKKVSGDDCVVCFFRGAGPETH